MAEGVFSAYSRYYDLLYRDKDYAAEADRIRAILVDHGVSGGSLLEFGSGTGRHGRLLAARGYRVHGVELSAEMVARAEQVDGFTCEQGDICTVSLGRQFDAVLSLFHVMSYQTTNARLNAVFDRACEHLRPDGLFVFDFWYSPAVYALQPSVRVKRMADSDAEVTRIAEPACFPNEDRVDVHYTIFVRHVASNVTETITEVHPMRHFSLPEIDLLAETHGFARIGACELLTGGAPGASTWGVCVTLRKAS